MDIAKPESWKTTPIPEQISELSYGPSFSDEEFEQIRRGLIPQQMEDKWFIVLTDLTLNLHRSWTGYCIYQIEFVRDGDQYSASRSIANRDPEQYAETDNAYDAEMLDFLIQNLLLGKGKPFPMPSNLPDDLPKGAYQHHISGTGYPEKNKDENSWWKFWNK